ncbi:MAG: hypothetical protein FWD54_04455 [Endomicrobia bacterium]|nr:hypothetical protein [Endomicrobiia bacterium]
MVKQKKDFSILNSKKLPAEKGNDIEFCTHKKINVVDEVQKELRENEENNKRIPKYSKYLKNGSDEEKAKLIQESHKAISSIVDMYIAMRQRNRDIEIKDSDDKNYAFLEIFLAGKYDKLPEDKREK